MVPNLKYNFKIPLFQMNKRILKSKLIKRNQEFHKGLRKMMKQKIFLVNGKKCYNLLKEINFRKVLKFYQRWMMTCIFYDSF